MSTTVASLSAVSDYVGDELGDFGCQPLGGPVGDQYPDSYSFNLLWDGSVLLPCSAN